MQFGTNHLGHFALTGLLLDLLLPVPGSRVVTVRAATDPSVLGGQYHGPDGLAERRGHPRLVTSSADSYDSTVQQRLWAVSEDLTGVRFPVGRATVAA